MVSLIVLSHQYVIPVYYVPYVYMTFKTCSLLDDDLVGHLSFTSLSPQAIILQTFTYELLYGPVFLIFLCKP